MTDGEVHHPYRQTPTISEISCLSSMISKVSYELSYASPLLKAKIYDRVESFLRFSDGLLFLISENLDMNQKFPTVFRLITITDIEKCRQYRKFPTVFPSGIIYYLQEFTTNKISDLNK